MNDNFAASSKVVHSPSVMAAVYALRALPPGTVRTWVGLVRCKGLGMPRSCRGTGVTGAARGDACMGGDIDTGMVVEVLLFAMATATRGADSEAGQCAKRSRRCGVENSMTPPTTVKTALHVRRGLEDIISDV